MRNKFYYANFLIPESEDPSCYGAEVFTASTPNKDTTFFMGNDKSSFHVYYFQFGNDSGGISGNLTGIGIPGRPTLFTGKAFFIRA